MSAVCRKGNTGLVLMTNEKVIQQIASRSPKHEQEIKKPTSVQDTSQRDSTHLKVSMLLLLPTLEPKQHQPQDLNLHAHGVKEHPKAPGGMQSAKAEILENR